MKIYMYAVGLCSLLILAGCASAKVEMAQLPGAKAQSKVFHNSFYGFHWSSNSVFEKARINGVTTKTNMLYSFVSVFSFGLYVPQEIEWYTLSQRQPPANIGSGMVRPPANIGSGGAKPLQRR